MAEGFFTATFGLQKVVLCSSYVTDVISQILNFNGGETVMTNAINQTCP